jgi:hypothetical protein
MNILSALRPMLMLGLLLDTGGGSVSDAAFDRWKKRERVATTKL